MNSAELKEAKDIESSTANESDVTQPSASGILENARLRYALIAVTALLAAWLALSIRRSLAEIDAEVEKIHSNLISAKHR